MKKIFTLTALLLVAGVLSAQTFRCSFSGPAVPPVDVDAQTYEEEELEDLVDEVTEALLNDIGLSNFHYDVYPASNVRNFQAQFDKYSGDFEIYYSFTFLKNIRRRLTDDDEFVYAIAIIVAHELGHHMNGHIYDSPDSDNELEADYFAGKRAAIVGIPYESAVWVYQTCTSVGETDTHPGRSDRIDAFTEGYNDGL